MLEAKFGDDLINTIPLKLSKFRISDPNHECKDSERNLIISFCLFYKQYGLLIALTDVILKFSKNREG